MDMGVSHALARHFFWSQNILWKEDIGDRNLTVSLSGRDLIVDTESVGRYMVSSSPLRTQPLASSSVLINIDEHLADHSKGALPNTITREVNLAAEEEAVVTDDWKERPWKGRGIDVVWFEKLDHAQVFDKPATRRPLLRAIRAYCAETGNGYNGYVGV
jgi:hypothetical protein